MWFTEFCCYPLCHIIHFCICATNLVLFHDWRFCVRVKILQQSKLQAEWSICWGNFNKLYRLLPLHPLGHPFNLSKFWPCSPSSLNSLIYLISFLLELARLESWSIVFFSIILFPSQIQSIIRNFWMRHVVVGQFGSLGWGIWFWCIMCIFWVLSLMGDLVEMMT